MTKLHRSAASCKSLYRIKKGYDAHNNYVPLSKIHQTFSFNKPNLTHTPYQNSIIGTPQNQSSPYYSTDFQIYIIHKQITMAHIKKQNIISKFHTLESPLT